MSNSIIVGVSQRIEIVASYDEQRDALDQRLIEWLVAVGCTPIPIPNTLISIDSSKGTEDSQKLLEWLETLNIQAIVLSGGNNIGEFSMRDRTENTLLSWAENHAFPVLGICRGMQMMGTWAGVQLIKVTGHVKTKHKLKRSQKFMAGCGMVNSYHDFVLKECPEYFKVTARSEDGSLEAMVHSTLPWEAWMWHPERETEFNPGDILQFKNLLSKEK
jgi:N5-(cytidine 5'-diphosphoramidyl)-L-glutamine hydrolase